MSKLEYFFVISYLCILHFIFCIFQFFSKDFKAKDGKCRRVLSASPPILLHPTDSDKTENWERNIVFFAIVVLNLFIIHFPDLRWNAIGILGGDSLLELIQVINIFHQKGGWKKTTKTSICRQRGGNATNNNKNIQLQTNPSLSRVDLQGNHIPKDTLRAIGSHRTISLSIIASSWSSLSSW